MPSYYPSALPSMKLTSSSNPSMMATNAFSWNQLGETIYGGAAGDQSGFSVSLSSDGKRVEIGAYQHDGNGSNAGHVCVYEYNDNTLNWHQLGGDID